MIFVRVIGGLGNQMFQYAHGRALSNRLGVPLRLDVSGFRKYRVHAYSLDKLNIRRDYATKAEIDTTLGRLFRLRQLVQRAVPSMNVEPRVLVRETSMRFDPRMLETPDGSYLEGYWQSEKYFKDLASTLREEFAPRRPLSGRDAEVAASMQATDSVSLHVRRGDYASNPATARFHGLCDETYYARCVRHITDRVKAPRFFVFSDDPDWARTNINIPFPTTFVSHETDSPDYVDLTLMSCCRHSIIANSTFSWWGAWLNRNPGKIVLMPARWYKALPEDETADLRPEGWNCL